MSTSGQRRVRGTSADLPREAVLSAAQRVIEDEGFEATPLRAVATRLGVSPAVIYDAGEFDQQPDMVLGEFHA